MAELLDGRLVLLLPTRPLVPAVGLELVVGLVEPTCGRLVLPVVGRLELLPLTVGRVPLAALIEPLVVRPETEAPFCGLLPWVRPLNEPPVPLLPCLTLAT